MIIWKQICALRVLVRLQLIEDHDLDSILLHHSELLQCCSYRKRNYYISSFTGVHMVSK
jgi:hypothetical protein